MYVLMNHIIENMVKYGLSRGFFWQCISSSLGSREAEQLLLWRWRCITVSTSFLDLLKPPFLVSSSSLTSVSVIIVDVRNIITFGTLMSSCRWRCYSHPLDISQIQTVTLIFEVFSPFHSLMVQRKLTLVRISFLFPGNGDLSFSTVKPFFL